MFLITASLAQTNSDADFRVRETQKRQKDESNRSKIPEELKEKLKLTDAERLEFKEIKNNSKGRIVKIWNSPCKDERVLDARDTFCLEQSKFIYASHYEFPGASSFAGINLITGEFETLNSRISQALLVDLGEVNLSRVSKETNEVQILHAFPLPDQDKVKKQVLPAGGLNYQGLNISGKQPAKSNHTYLLRTVTYFDKPVSYNVAIPVKRETIHALQVLKEKDNVVAIIWKEIKLK